MILTREVVTCHVKMGTKILCRWISEQRMNKGQSRKRAASLPEWHAAASAPCGKRPDYYLALPETDRRSVNALLRDAVDPEDIDNQMAVIKGITARAKKGDPQAANVLLKMLGEDNPPDDTAADTLEHARELLGGIDSAID